MHHAEQKTHQEVRPAGRFPIGGPFRCTLPFLAKASCANAFSDEMTVLQLAASDQVGMDCSVSKFSSGIRMHVPTD